MTEQEQAVAERDWAHDFRFAQACWIAVLRSEMQPPDERDEATTRARADALLRVAVEAGWTNLAGHATDVVENWERKHRLGRFAPLGPKRDPDPRNPAVQKFDSVVAGAVAALRECAKQHRKSDAPGHATMADAHAERLAREWATLQGGI